MKVQRGEVVRIHLYLRSAIWVDREKEREKIQWLGMIEPLSHFNIATSLVFSTKLVADQCAPFQVQNRSGIQHKSLEVW